MRRVLCASLFLSSFAFAEIATPGTPQQPQQQQPQNRGVKVFDDGVFVLSSDKKEPTTTKSQTGAERPLASEPDYNTEQREQWLETCAPQQEANPKGYRDCYKREKKKTTDANKRRMNSVNEREKQQFRTAEPIPDSAPLGNPLIPDVEIKKD